MMDKKEYRNKIIENLDECARNVKEWRECISPDEHPDAYRDLLFKEQEIRDLLKSFKSRNENGQYQV